MILRKSVLLEVKQKHIFLITNYLINFLFFHIKNIYIIVSRDVYKLYFIYELKDISFAFFFAQNCTKKSISLFSILQNTDYYSTI